MAKQISNVESAVKSVSAFIEAEAKRLSDKFKRTLTGADAVKIMAAKKTPLVRVAVEASPHVKLDVETAKYGKIKSETLTFDGGSMLLKDAVSMIEAHADGKPLSALLSGSKGKQRQFKDVSEDDLDSILG